MPIFFLGASGAGGSQLVRPGDLPRHSENKGPRSKEQKGLEKPEGLGQRVASLFPGGNSQDASYTDAQVPGSSKGHTLSTCRSRIPSWLATSTASTTPPSGSFRGPGDGTPPHRPATLNPSVPSIWACSRVPDTRYVPPRLHIAKQDTLDTLRRVTRSGFAHRSLERCTGRGARGNEPSHVQASLRLHRSSDVENH